MPLDLPSTADEVVQRSQTDVQRELEGSNPFLENSWLGSLVISLANRIFDFYIQLQTAIDLNFPDTTSGTFLDRWASIYGVPRLAATQSAGNVVVTGTALIAIPLGTSFQSSNGLTYESTAAATITIQILTVASIVREGSLVTVTTDDDHGIASNVEVTIAGADQGDYNGTQTITVTAADAFQYTVETTPVTPATGTITATFTSASVPLQSDDFDTEDDTVNQSLDTILTLGSPIAGVTNDASVDFEGIEGGTPQETDAELSARLLSRIQNPIAHFNSADIENQAKLVNGVTRVFVEEITPTLGQVTIYFTRDNDDDIIPSASEVLAVKESILEITPANTAFAAVIVAAPTAVPVPFTFTNIFPDTTTMETAIEDNLAQFFLEETSVGDNVDEDKYRAAIINTIDLANGDELQTFTLSSPTSDIIISAGELATLSTVTFT